MPQLSRSAWAVAVLFTAAFTAAYGGNVVVDATSTTSGGAGGASSSTTSSGAGGGSCPALTPNEGDACTSPGLTCSVTVQRCGGTATCSGGTWHVTPQGCAQPCPLCPGTPAGCGADAVCVETSPGGPAAVHHCAPSPCGDQPLSCAGAGSLCGAAGCAAVLGLILECNALGRMRLAHARRDAGPQPPVRAPLAVSICTHGMFVPSTVPAPSDSTVAVTGRASCIVAPFDLLVCCRSSPNAS